MIHAGVVGFDLSGPEKGYPPDAHLAECRLRQGIRAGPHAARRRRRRTAEHLACLRSLSRAAHRPRCPHHRRHHRPQRRDRCATASWPAPSATTGCRSRCARRRTCTRASPPDPRTTRSVLLYRAGFNVTLNTDNRLMSDVTMTDEFSLAVDHHGFTTADLEAVTVNALEAGFGSWSDRRRLHRRGRAAGLRSPRHTLLELTRRASLRRTRAHPLPPARCASRGAGRETPGARPPSTAASGADAAGGTSVSSPPWITSVGTRDLADSRPRLVHGRQELSTKPGRPFEIDQGIGEVCLANRWVSRELLALGGCGRAARPAATLLTSLAAVLSGCRGVGVERRSRQHVQVGLSVDRSRHTPSR